MNLQDSFLNQARLQKIPLNIYLVNGFQIKGVVTGFDSFIIMLDAPGKQSMIYKHAISTITPLKPIQLFKNESAEAQSVTRSDVESDIEIIPAQEDTYDQNQ